MGVQWSISEGRNFLLDSINWRITLRGNVTAFVMQDSNLLHSLTLSKTMNNSDNCFCVIYINNYSLIVVSLKVCYGCSLKSNWSLRRINYLEPCQYWHLILASLCYMSGAPTHFPLVLIYINRLEELSRHSCCDISYRLTLSVIDKRIPHDSGSAIIMISWRAVLLHSQRRTILA